MHYIKLDRLPFLYGVLSIWVVVGFLPTLPVAVGYVATGLFALYCAYNSKGIDNLWLCFLIYIALDLIITQPHSAFQSWPRFLLFLAVSINVSSLSKGKKLMSIRLNLFKLILLACAVLGVGSFFARFLGINYMIIPEGYETFVGDTIHTTGLFAGLTIHSMLLGPIAGIGACYLTSLALTKKKKWLWMLVMCTAGAVLFAASRSAAAATLAAVMIVVYIQSGRNSKFLGTLIIASIVLAVTFSLWSSALTGLLEKNRGTSINFDSRQELWLNGIKDFLENPLFGAGFCASSNLSGVDLTNGRIESGSSWINVFSMLGIFGAVFVISIFVRALLRAYHSENEIKPLICGVLILFFIHMFAEGYVFAAGNFLTVVLWLTVGVASDTKYKAV